MTFTALVVLGTLAGAAVGWAAEHLPVPAVVQSLVAVFVAGVATALAVPSARTLAHRMRGCLPCCRGFRVCQPTCRPDGKD